jgi:hypothetical protein
VVEHTIGNHDVNASGADAWFKQIHLQEGNARDVVFGGERLT